MTKAEFLEDYLAGVPDDAQLVFYDAFCGRSIPLVPSMTMLVKGDDGYCHYIELIDEAST